MTTLRRFTADDIFKFNNVYVDITVSGKEPARSQLIEICNATPPLQNEMQLERHGHSHPYLHFQFTQQFRSIDGKL